MGIKLFEFVRRAPGLSIDEFRQRWRLDYATELANSRAAGRFLQRWEQNPRLLADYRRDRHALEVDDVGCDGVDVRWFASRSDLERFEADPEVVSCLNARRATLFAGPPMRVVTADPVSILDEPGRETANAKLLCILRRNRALDADAFHAHWQHHHGGLFQRIAELRDPIIAYDQNHGMATDAAFDGVTEQWFADLATFSESLRAPANATDVAPDVAYMLDPTGVHFIMAEQPFVVRG